MLKDALQPMMLAAAILAGTAIGGQVVVASDHDDGTTDVKTLNTNLTDLFVFNEDSHNTALDNDNVVLIMNVNPRSLPQQQYYFHTDALYEFNVHHVQNGTTQNTTIPEAATTADVTLRLQFGDPDSNNRQAITLTRVEDGTAIDVASNATARTSAGTGDATDLGAGPVLTTAHPFTGEVAETNANAGTMRAEYPTDTAIVNTVSLGGQTIEVFAGLREDPFFFDVERYFKVRAALARDSAATKFVKGQETDFTAGYNVLSIVLKVPRAVLADDSGATTFDVWETVKVRS